MSKLEISTETINIHQHEGTLTVELDRPQVLNAWNEQFAAELQRTLDWADESEQVRCVVLTGAGRAFSAGADLKDFASAELTADGRPDLYKTLTSQYNPIIHSIRNMPKPVVAAVNGPAVGIGCSLALSCDLVIGAQNAYFLLAFVNIGLAADGGCSLLLPTRVGIARASEMALLGKRVSAEQALQWGMINRVVPDAQLRDETQKLAQELAAGPTRSYAATKRQLNNLIYPRLSEQLELEAQIQQEMAGTEDFLEGTMAFLEKRRARFHGR
jgi:2-(1,2-epoxy-1,2-dihydrophenyl)acetyl-CoA isomerase